MGLYCAVEGASVLDEVYGAQDKGSRGSDPRLLRLTMGGLLDRTFGERPRASRIVQRPKVKRIKNLTGAANISLIYIKEARPLGLQHDFAGRSWPPPASETPAERL